jgi:hypothetical protein
MDSGNPKLIFGAYIKYIENVKIFRKNSHVAGHVLCVHVKFHIKLTNSVLCVKKKKKSQEMDYFITKNLSFFT